MSRVATTSTPRPKISAITTWPSLTGACSLTLRRQAAQSITFSFGKLDLDMTPTLRLDKVPLGKSIALDALGGTLKITNRGDDPVKLKFASNRVIASLREPGWTDPPHPEWLSMKPAVVKVKPNQIKPVKLFLKIPDAPENRGQKFQFLITAELADLGIPLQYYTRVYVTTE